MPSYSRAPTNIRTQIAKRLVTLIVSLLTPDFVVQVGDTRVVLPLATGGVEWIDDFQNKLTYYDGRAVFGYCGLACLENLRTDEWITRELSQRTFESDAHAVESLARRAREAINATQLEPKHRRLAIAGVGWVGAPEQEAQYSVVWRCQAKDLVRYGSRRRA